MRNLMVVFAVVLAVTLVGSVATAELFLNEYVTIQGFGGYGLQLNNTYADPYQWEIYQHNSGNLVVAYTGVGSGLMAVGKNGSIGLGAFPVGDHKLVIANGHIEMSNGYGMFFGSGVDTALYGSGAAGTAYIRADVPGQPGALYINNDGYVGIPKALDVGKDIAADEDVVADADGIPVSLINLNTQINAVDSGLLDRLEALEAIVMDLPPGLLNQKDRNADTK